jgi:hypothetical protein
MKYFRNLPPFRFWILFCHCCIRLLVLH